MRIFDSIDLRHLRALDMMLTERSITRAAERLAVTQPAISNSLSRLRDHFGDDLLVRQGARLVLTPFAERLQPTLRHVLMDVQAITTARPHFDPAGAEQTFSMMVPDHLAAIFLPELVRDMAACSPRSRVLCFAPSPLSRTMLETGELDLTIQPLSQMLPDHPHEMLFAEPWIYIARQDHPAAHDGVGEEAIAALPQVRALLPRGEHHGPRDGIAPVQTSAALIPAIVAGSDLVARVPSSLADFHRQQCARPLRTFSCSDLPTPIHMQWPSRKNGDPASSWFRSKASMIFRSQINVIKD